MIMNRIVYSFLLILFLGMSNISIYAEGTQPSVGDGSQANPYQIGTAAELVWFRDFVNQGGEHLSACAELTADVDLSGIEWSPIVTTTNAPWTGTFDGKGKKIDKLSIHQSQDEYTGLFGVIDGTIKNLTISGNIEKTSGNTCGAGMLFGKGGANTLVSNCIINGTIRSIKKSGGICSTCEGGTIANCINNATVTVTNGDGGGIAFYFNGTLTNCVNTGNITVQSSANYVGGLFGQVNGKTIIKNSGNSGNITTSSAANVGSFIGHVSNGTVTISDSYNYGGINTTTGSSNYAGIIIGYVKDIKDITLSNVIYNSNATYTKGTSSFSKAVGKDQYTDITATSLPSTDFTSGKVCYLLNGNQSTINWYQAIGTDDCPTPIGNTNSIVYRVQVNGGEAFVNENGTVDQIAFTDGEDFITPVSFTITDAQYSRAMTNNWGTLCMPYSLNASECSGVEFYEISSVSNTAITLTQITGSIDAGKPVFFIKTSADGQVNFNAANAVIQPAAGTTTESISHWNTIGTYTNQSITDNTNAYYFVASDKIYPKEPSRALTVKPFRAYLSAPSSAGARQFSIEVMGEATAIDVINSLNDDNVEIYDINGIRKPSLSKGINIINGKKIIIR